MSDNDAAAALARRVAALEAVVTLERRLRKLQDATHSIRTGSQAIPPAGPARPVDDDATVIAPRPANPAFPAERAAEPVAATALALAPGFELFEYRIDAVLGQGGFGITYLATDVHLNAKVAIKEYLPGDYAQRSSDKSVAPRWPEHSEFYQHGLDSFLVEARTLATFRHPHIVRVVRFFEANRTAYMVLDYERGKPLRQWWKERKDLPEADILSLVQPLLDGLAVVHGAGYLHRDIKPDNIYVRKDDGSLVLLDFGAARQTVGTTGPMGDAITPGYAPAEQYNNGAQGAWTDIYAFGATLYWMITGAKPPPAPARIDGSAPMISAIEAGRGRYSEGFLRAVDWALELDPAARPQSVQALSQTLFAAHSGSLALRDALAVGDDEPHIVVESWRALLDSPRLLKQRVVQLWRALVRPESWPLAIKMTLAMVLAALLPMSITNYYNVEGAMGAVSSSELRNLEQLAQSTAGRVGQLVADSQTMANYMSTDADLIAYLRAPDETRKQVVDAKLANLIKEVPYVHLMILMNTDGVALVSSEPGVAGKNFKFREYFQQALKGQTYKTGIILGTTVGKPGMYYANPVFDLDKKVIGVVVLRVRGATISQILEEVQADSHRLPFMVDGEGVLIHYPDEKHLYRSLVPLAPPALKRIADEQRFGKNPVGSVNMPDLGKAMIGAKKTGNISFQSTLSGVEEHAGYAPVPGHDWVVGVSESRELFEEPLTTLFAHVLYSVVGIGLVFLVLAVLFARSIVRPIARLTEAANALKDGDYERANIKVTSSDEIGRLARTFNVMIDVLRQRERERRRGRPDL